LVGLEAYKALRDLVSADLLTACVTVVVVSLVLFVVRLAFLVSFAYTARLVDRLPTQRSAT
jgi:hypothetical protein